MLADKLRSATYVASSGSVSYIAERSSSVDGGPFSTAVTLPAGYVIIAYETLGTTIGTNNPTITVDGVTATDIYHTGRLTGSGTMFGYSGFVYVNVASAGSKTVVFTRGSTWTGYAQVGLGFWSVYSGWNTTTVGTGFTNQALDPFGNTASLTLTTSANKPIIAVYGNKGNSNVYRSSGAYGTAASSSTTITTTAISVNNGITWSGVTETYDVAADTTTSSLVQQFVAAICLN